MREHCDCPFLAVPEQKSQRRKGQRERERTNLSLDAPMSKKLCQHATMSSSARLPVVPTVTVLAVMKSRLAGAIKGHSLLKKKADALTIR